MFSMFKVLFGLCIIWSYFKRNLRGMKIQSILVWFLLMFAVGYGVHYAKHSLSRGNSPRDSTTDGLVSKLKTCPATVDLLADVLEQGPIQIKIMDAPMGALWQYETRMIGIDPKEPSARQLGHLVWELCSASKNQAHTQFRQDLVNGKVGREDYVERWERLDWETTRQFLQVIQPCIDHSGWERATLLDMDQIPDLWVDWDSFYSVFRVSAHANQYRKDWDAKLKEIFCGRHPKSADCRK